MSNREQLPEEEEFSDNPEQNLSMQNDFLKMKMMAESGAIFGGSADLPSDIENQFLKNVMEFEKANSVENNRSIYQILDNPEFEDEKNLDEEKFRKEFFKLFELLKVNNINVEFNRERNDRFKYNFITKELFQHKTSFVPVKGMSTYFLYEEFHPTMNWK